MSRQHRDHRRLPWRAGADTLHRTFARMSSLRLAHAGALRIYLRRTILIFCGYGTHPAAGYCQVEATSGRVGR